MKTLPTFFLSLFLLNVTAQKEDSLMLRKFYDYYLTKSSCYANLRELTQSIGGRLSGSPQAAKAVDWARKAMYAAGADTVLLQPGLVPHWVRGKKEICRIAGAKPQELQCVALGSSVGTGAKGLTAAVIEVKSFEELEQLGKTKIEGRIVFFNVPFDQSKIHPGSAYREVGKFRVLGASQAAKYGAVGMLVRSLSSLNDDVPHTGNMHYDTSLSKTKIPALALGCVSADKLSNALKQQPALKVYVETHCETLPDVLSYNVVGQINGSEKPNEFLIAGGHLDSWDNGEGAHDDGAGVVQSIELLAAFKHLGIRPKHSIRAVAFMNEENGLRGGDAYAAFAKEKNEKHLAALETDAGGFVPRSIGVDTTQGLYTLVATFKELFQPYLLDNITRGGGGADLRSLQKNGVPCIGFDPDGQRYFDIHHTAEDTFDKIHKRELELGAGAIGGLLYLIDIHTGQR